MSQVAVAMDSGRKGSGARQFGKAAVHAAMREANSRSMDVLGERLAAGVLTGRPAASYTK
jgi:hypothetical protein